jgi:hypothetical protein
MTASAPSGHVKQSQLFNTGIGSFSMQNHKVMPIYSHSVDFPKTATNAYFSMEHHLLPMYVLSVI